MKKVFYDVAKYRDIHYVFQITVTMYSNATSVIMEALIEGITLGCECGTFADTKAPVVHATKGLVNDFFPTMEIGLVGMKEKLIAEVEEYVDAGYTAGKYFHTGFKALEPTE